MTERLTYWEAIQKLIGHACGTAVLFLSLAVLAWLIGWAVTTMEEAHAFHPTILEALHSVEVALLFLDFLISGIVISISAFRFVREIIGARS